MEVVPHNASTLLVLIATILLMRFGFVHSLISTDLSSSKIFVDDQGRYQNLVISINLKMKQIEDEESFLEAVKTHVTGLSESVYETTGLQFGNVTILVPSDWSGDSYPQTYNQGAESAEVIIQPLEVELYTQHIQGCGKQALFMAIDAAYIRDKADTNLPSNTLDKLKKQLMHEWLHTRYGVFDEHPLEGRHDLALDPTAIDQQRFYHSSSSTQEAVRCSLALETESECQLTQSNSYDDMDMQTFLPKKSCSFTVIPPDSPTPSLMSNPEIDNVNQLCDRETHNDEAPNRQNRLCNGRSIMEVISDHEDFKKLEEVQEKLGDTSYKIPVYTVQRLRSRRTIVIVLDTSKSMAGSRLFLAKQAIGSMVEHIIEDYASIMIIGFSKTAKKLYPLDRDTPVELDSKERRLEVLEDLSNVTTGSYTCIGCGLELGYDFIKNQQKSIGGTFFVLLTDGVNNWDEKALKEMLGRSKREGFFIDTILLSNEVDDELVDLLRDTGSRVFSATDDPSALVDGFTEIIGNRQNLSSQVIQIYSQLERVGAKQDKSNQFIVEGQLIELAEIVFYWNASAQPFLSFSVTRENDGYTLLNKTRATLSKLGYLKVALYDEQYRVDSHPLRFRYHIENSHSSLPLTSTVTVNTRSEVDVEDRNRRRRDVNQEYIQEYGMRTFIDGEGNFTVKEGFQPKVSIHAYLPLGSTDGLPDDVTATVTATSLTNNQTDEFKVKLRDLGTGADVIGGDRVYSGFFTNYVTYNATYYVRIRAIGSGFMRYSSTGYFVVYIEPSLNGKVHLPPCSITDLQVLETGVDNVKVTFAAPGDDLDSGYVSHYRIWCSNSSRELRRRDAHVSVTHFTHLTPILAYEQERLDIKISSTGCMVNETVWIGITAIDDDGWESNMSNPVSSRYMPGIEPMPNDTKGECPSGTIIRCFADLHFYIVVGSAALLALLLLGIVLCCCCCCCKPRDSGDDEAELHNNDSATLSSLSSDPNMSCGMHFEHTGLAFHDEMQIVPAQITTYRRQPLPSTKKRIQSINFGKSLKTVSRKTTKPPAPAPPSDTSQSVKQPTAANGAESKKSNTNARLDALWVDSKTNKTVVEKAPNQRASSGIQYLHSNRTTPHPESVDTSTMAADLATAENYCSNFVNDEKKKSSIEEEDSKSCTSYVDVRL